MNEQGLLEVARKLTTEPPIEASQVNSTYNNIIEHCKKHYVSILPKNINRWMENGSGASTAISTFERDESKSSDIDKQHLEEIVRQLAIVVQMLLQVCVLSGDGESRLKSYNLLEKVRQLMVKDVEQMEKILLNKTGRAVNHCRINFTDFLPQQEKQQPIVVQMPPQMSIYQQPLLYLLSHKVAHRQLFQNLQPTEQQSVGLKLIQSFVPFVNPLFIPVIEETSGKSKGKFSPLDDRLFLMGLSRHSSKNIDRIQVLYVPTRTEDQLKNRIKNLCAKSTQNEIKLFKQNEYLPLSDSEVRRFAEGLVRFGPRFKVISKYMLLRTPKLLEEEYTECQRLQKKRERQGITNPPIKQRLMQYQADFVGRMQVEQQDNDRSEIMSESYFLALKERSECSQMEPEQKRERYKIIGSMTFQYDEL